MSRQLCNRIAYTDDAGEWGSLQIDFIVISRRDDGTLAASIIDPHGDHLADARAKLVALAQYAEEHGHRYVRIESVAKDSHGNLRKLSLSDPRVRQAVREFRGGKVTAIYDDPSVSLPYL